MNGATNIDLAGTAGNSNAAVDWIDAYNNANQAYGIAVGTGGWSVTDIPLPTGTSNLITITATGTTWSQVWGGETSFNAS